MANKYIGPESCYAKKEDVYIPRIDSGLNEATFFSVMALILRDLRRGWSYNDNCNITPFSKSYALQRAIWGGALTFTFTDIEVAKVLMELSRVILETGRVPEWAPIILTGKNSEKLKEELVNLGIARPGQIKTAKEKEGGKIWLSLP